MPHTQDGIWSLLEVLFQISHEYPRPFYMGVPHAPGILGHFGVKEINGVDRDNCHRKNIT